jgi:hypothetical protein
MLKTLFWLVLDRQTKTACWMKRVKTGILSEERKNTKITWLRKYQPQGESHKTKLKVHSTPSGIESFEDSSRTQNLLTEGEMEFFKLVSTFWQKKLQLIHID